MSNLALAQTVKLSPTAVLERVRRLVREHYILGYEARLNPHKLAASLLVFIEVMLDRTAPDVIERFEAAVLQHPEIMECHLVAADGFDFLLKTRVADMAAYRNFLGEVLLQLPGVREVHTHLVLEEVRSSQQLRVA